MYFRSLKWISVSFVLSYLLCSALIECNKYTADGQHSESCTGDFCFAEDEIEEPCMDEGDVPGPDNVDELKEGLYRWAPVEVGHVRQLELEPNKVYEIITRSMDPPIFEIPGFLTDEECEGIINRTRKHGLFSSHVHMDPEAIEHEKKVKIFAAESKYLYLDEKEVDEMIKKLELTEFDDGNVTVQEFASLKTAAIEKYFLDMKKTHPKHRDRYSEQTWLPLKGSADKMMKSLRDRVVKLTKLPKKIVAGGEHLQVVHYDVRGHYHAHYDSQSGKQFSQFKCCHQHLDKLPDCRLCRYITVLYYLNRPEKGGETAFPAADIEGFNETDFRERREGDQYNLSKFCHNASLVVPPKKGTAIMWYNHYRDESGWLGDLDWKTLHGGCDILEGEKWIANNWLTAPENGEQHIPSYYYSEETEEEGDIEEDGGNDSGGYQNEKIH